MRRHYWADFFEKIPYLLQTNFRRPSCSRLASHIMPHLRWSSDQTASDRSSNTDNSFIFNICVSSKVQGQMSSNSIFDGECPLFNKRYVFFSKKEFNLVLFWIQIKECTYHGFCHLWEKPMTWRVSEIWILKVIIKTINRVCKQISG